LNIADHLELERQVKQLRRQGLDPDEILDRLNGAADSAMVPGIIQRIVLLNPTRELREFSHLTDAGNAERFVDHYSGVCLYVPTWRSWRFWDGARYAADGTRRETRFALETVAAIHREAARVTAGEKRADGLTAKDLSKWARDSESATRVQAMISLAAARMAVAPDVFDCDPWVLNCRNGVLDLRTGKLAAHDPSQRFTKITAAPYDPAERAPGWLAFLDRITGGDESLVSFLKRVLGYSLTGSVREQVFFLAYGRGANGKSTLLEVTRAVLGDYAAQTGFETFLAKRNDDGVRNEIAALRGARLVTASEAPAGRRFSEAVLKQLTGGDVVRARFLYQEAFEFRPECKIVLSSNHRPRIGDNSHAMWRRVKLIPFNVTIALHERVADLAERLVAEEAAGILAWMVEGCLEWQRVGLGEPHGVVEATDAYRDEEDGIGAFVDACCEMRPDLMSTAGDLYRLYKSWTERNEQEAISQTAFGRALGELGLRRVKGKHVITWHGIGITAAVDGSLRWTV
jgi:putative DNA primase/helicase